MTTIRRVESLLNKDQSVSGDWTFSGAVTLPSAATYTPTLYGSSAAGTPTYSTQTGSYLDLGSIVFFTINIALTAITGITGNIRITLPETVGSAGGMIKVGASSGYSVASGKNITADINPSTNYIRLRQSDDNDTSTNIAVAGITASLILELGGFYFK